MSPDFQTLEAFQHDRVASQPWRQTTNGAPTSLKDIGLEGRLKLVLFEAGWYEVKIIVADERGRMFAFCATDDRGRSEGYNGAFLLGDIEPSPGLPQAQLKTESYQFLFSLVWSFADDPRYQYDKAYQERVRIRLGLSEEDFALFMKEPVLR